MLQTEFHAAENIPCYVLENIKIRLKSGRALTGLKDGSDGLLPIPLDAVGLVLSTDIGGWISLSVL